MNIKLVAGVAALLAVGTAGAANATDLIVNGGFESNTLNSSTTGLYNTQFGNGYAQSVTGWTGSNVNNAYNLYFSKDPTSLSAASQYDSGQGTGSEFLQGNASQFAGHGAFVALDGDPTVQSYITQSVTGLVAGKSYTLSFDWGAGQVASRTGATTEQLLVSLGSQQQATSILSNASASFTGWNSVTMTFTATGTSETLEFLSAGTPTGLPPIAVLDNVSLSQNVPEPSTIGLMGAGLALLGYMGLRRRRSAL